MKVIATVNIVLGASVLLLTGNVIDAQYLHRQKRSATGDGNGIITLPDTIGILASKLDLGDKCPALLTIIAKILLGESQGSSGSSCVKDSDIENLTKVLNLNVNATAFLDLLVHLDLFGTGSSCEGSSSKNSDLANVVINLGLGEPLGNLINLLVKVGLLEGSPCRCGGGGGKRSGKGSGEWGWGSGSGSGKGSSPGSGGTSSPCGGSW